MLLSFPLDNISPALYFFLVENVSCISKIFHNRKQFSGKKKVEFPPKLNTTELETYKILLKISES